MKLHIMSDLHLEFDKYTMTLPEVEADVLILAGDIGLGTQDRDWIVNLSDRYKHIIKINGNHEFYKQNYRVLRNKRKAIEDSTNAKSKGAKFHYLDPGIIEFENHIIIGATLWTDFKSGDSSYMMNARAVMNDYNLIKDFTPDYDPPSMLSPFTVFEQHKRDRAYVSEKLDQYSTKKKIVVTHHAPSQQSVHPKYMLDKHSREFNYFYYSELEHLVEKSNLWIHGHTHTNFDYKVGNSRVICNPRGYHGRDMNPQFNPELVIEI